MGAPVKSSGSDGGHVQRQQVNDQPLPWEEGQSTPASGQCEVDPNPIKSQGDSGVTTEEGTHPFQLARQKIKEAPIVQKAARFAEKANVRLKQSTSMVEASKILLEPYEKYVLGNKAIAKTKLGEMIQIEAEAYKVALSRAVAKPTKENLKNLATIAQSFSKNLAFVGQYTALHENYSKLPKTLRDTPAMIEIHGDLLSLQNALHTGKIDIEGGVALAEKFTVTMVGLWSSVINKGDQNLAGILETLKSPKHGFDPQTAVELDQIEQSLSENSDAPLDMGLMVKHSGALMAAMGIAQTFDPGRLDAIRKVPDPLLRSAIGMSQIENILQSKDTPAMFKENPEVLLAFFVDQGIVTADGIGAERLTQLVP